MGVGVRLDPTQIDFRTVPPNEVPPINCWASYSDCIASIAGIALFIIGCIGAAGVFPGSTIGWVTVGLGGGIFVLNLAKGDLKKRICEVILAAMFAASLISVGALGGCGILSISQVGLGIIGTSLASCPLGSLLRCPCLQTKELQPQLGTNVITRLTDTIERERSQRERQWQEHMLRGVQHGNRELAEAVRLQRLQMGHSPIDLSSLLN